MLPRWQSYLFSLAVLLGLAPALFAQANGAPATAQAAAPAATPPAGAAAAPAPAPANLWSFLSLTPDQKAACREHLCRSAIGKLAGGLLQPVSAFSGGLIANPCALPTARDLAKPHDSAAGAAAAIKQDEVDAKERRAAVRYLGTVECNRWPEAETALINSLRGDRNECVRLEAAWVLGRGCCCTPKIAAALSLTVAGSDRDGFPVERSERVRAAAAASLNHCLACLAPQVPVSSRAPAPEKEKEKEKSNEPPPKEVPLPRTLAPAGYQSSEPAESARAALNPDIQRALYYQQVDYQVVAPLVRQGREVARQQAPAGPAVTSDARTGGLFAVVSASFTPGQEASGHEVLQAAASQTAPGQDAPLPRRPLAPTGSGSLATVNRGVLPALWRMCHGQPAMPSGRPSAAQQPPARELGNAFRPVATGTLPSAAPLTVAGNSARQPASGWVDASPPAALRLGRPTTLPAPANPQLQPAGHWVVPGLESAFRLGRPVLLHPDAPDE